MEKCGHTSFFWWMVAFRLAADRGSMHEFVGMREPKAHLSGSSKLRRMAS